MTNGVQNQQWHDNCSATASRQCPLNSPRTTTRAWQTKYYECMAGWWSTSVEGADCYDTPFAGTALYQLCNCYAGCMQDLKIANMCKDACGVAFNGPHLSC
ncbi:hypothetical protein OC834_004009 [Tilletia horrida]|nr:hypothetical protein OC834_004009 [Tilletia horrida]